MVQTDHLLFNVKQCQPDWWAGGLQVLSLCYGTRHHLLTSWNFTFSCFVADTMPSLTWKVQYTYQFYYLRLADSPTRYVAVGIPHSSVIDSTNLVRITKRWEELIVSRLQAHYIWVCWVQFALVNLQFRLRFVVCCLEIGQVLRGQALDTWEIAIVSIIETRLLDLLLSVIGRFQRSDLLR